MEDLGLCPGLHRAEEVAERAADLQRPLQAAQGQAGGASDSEKLLLARLSDLVIPDSDTPGAVALARAVHRAIDR